MVIWLNAYVIALGLRLATLLGFRHVRVSNLL